MGEKARQPGAPDFPNTPLELLTPRPGQGYTLADRYLMPGLCTLGGLICVYLYNSVKRRPVWAGIHNYFLSGLAAYYASSFWHNSRLAARAERDEVYKHYITLHQEDFPPFERKRYKDVFIPWQPIR